MCIKSRGDIINTDVEHVFFNCTWRSNWILCYYVYNVVIVTILGMKHKIMMQDKMQMMIDMMTMGEKMMKGPKAAEKNREGELSRNSLKVNAGGFPEKRMMCRADTAVSLMGVSV